MKTSGLKILDSDLTFIGDRDFCPSPLIGNHSHEFYILGASRTQKILE